MFLACKQIIMFIFQSIVFLLLKADYEFVFTPQWVTLNQLQNDSLGTSIYAAHKTSTQIYCESFLKWNEFERCFYLRSSYHMNTRIFLYPGLFEIWSVKKKKTKKVDFLTQRMRYLPKLSKKQKHVKKKEINYPDFYSFELNEDVHKHN